MTQNQGHFAKRSQEVLMAQQKFIQQSQFTTPEGHAGPGEDREAIIKPLSTRNRITILFGGSIGLVLLVRLLLAVLTGLPLVPPYLYSFDTVNLALALKDFNPTRNQPQPPGYPFFVAEERLL